MSDGQLFDLKEFLWYIDHGAINDFDGIAEPATSEGKGSDTFINIRTLKKDRALPEPYTHVMWYNN